MRRKNLSLPNVNIRTWISSACIALLFLALPARGAEDAPLTTLNYKITGTYLKV